MRSEKEIKARIKHLKWHAKEFPKYKFRSDEEILALEWVLKED